MIVHAGALMMNALVSRALLDATVHADFADTEKTRRLLDQNGITFVGTRVLAKHLPAKSSRVS